MSKVFTITNGLENMGAMRTGGQGSVYKGRRMGPVLSAVKILPTPIYTEDDNDKNFINFQNEVDKLKKVNEVANPNVVTILNSGLTESGSFPFIEMEFIEGPDLGELLKAPNDPVFTIKETIKLADQLANALAHCHNLGIKHGDIKSNNVKYNIHSGNYVLLDFGLAVMSDEQRRTSLRHAGAVEFMAPEQNTGTVLFQTDVYSYGVILYELLAGRVPFPLDDNGETSRHTVMLAHMETPVPDLLKLRLQNLPETWTAEKKDLEMRVPQWLLNIISKCLEKDPQQRYPDGLALQEELITKSVDANASKEDVAGILILQEENEQLKAQLSKYQQTEADDKKLIKLNKPVFAALTLLLFAALLFGFIAMFNKKAPVVITAKQNYIPPSIAFPANNSLIKTSSKTVAANKTVKDSVLMPTAGNKLSQTKTPSASKKKHKKHKFLGIF
ncbi:serine/threonine protein kinase [Mucilaginibacter sp. AW1-3]